MPNKFSSLIAVLEGIKEGSAYGWVGADDHLKANLTIQLVLDEVVISESRANILRPDLGENFYGFLLKLPIDCFRSNKKKISLMLKEANLELKGSPVILDRKHRFSWGIDGYIDRNTLSGYLRDHVNPNSKFVIELLENECLIASSKNDRIIDEGGEVGRFIFSLPSSLMDEAVHIFTFRCVELNWNFETEAFLTPPNDPKDDYVPPPFIHDPEWESSPAGNSFKSKLLKQHDEDSATSKKISCILSDLENANYSSVEINYQMLCELGRLYSLDQKIDSALKYYRKAIKLQPFKSTAYVRLADTLISNGKEWEAEGELKTALKKIPEDTCLLGSLERLSALRDPKVKVKVIAFYLPQFHPIPENDKWWGKGFTEWANVAASKPLFGGHLQPRLPTDLGYYDLRLAESVNAQFELAHRYGIDAFCYYYYWFDGKKILDQPLHNLVTGKTGPFPFCICWANEDWTRSWDGMSGDVLLAQNHTEDSDFKFIKDVAHLLKHEDYVRYNNKPVLLIYRPDKLANPIKTVKAWRKWCLNQGIGEIHLCAVQSFGFDDPRQFGFDAAVEFPPHSPWNKYPNLNYYVDIPKPKDLTDNFSGKLLNYQSFADSAILRPSEPYKLHRTCMLAWDNSARRGKSAHIFHWFSVKKYHQWLLSNISKAGQEKSDGLTFINAWNEWAEGSTLEPSNAYGYSLLHATKHAIDCASLLHPMAFWKEGAPLLPSINPNSEEKILIVGHNALKHGAQINLLNMVRHFKRSLNVDVVILLLEGGDLVVEYEAIAKTYVLGQDPDWVDKFESIVSHYRMLGFNKALCNTVVTGSIVRVLKNNEFKVVSLIHELPSLIESYGLQNECYEITKNASAFVFASEVVASEFCERFNAKRDLSLIAPQGILFNPYHSKRNHFRKKIRDDLGLSQNTKIVIGCGYGDIRKGIDLFVQVASEVAVTNDSLAFVWVGEIDPSLIVYIQADLAKLGLTNRFMVTGNVANPNQYFIAADIFALTSREDPFPSVVMEAFDAGLPVVAFEGGGGYVDIVSEKTGALVPYLNVSMMAFAIDKLLKDNRLRKRISNRNHAICRNEFGYPQYLIKLMALFAGIPPIQIQNGKLTPEVWYGETNCPRISVIVPNYNYGRYLELRLSTILHQTLSPTEIIVLDDGSSDYSLDLVKKISEKSKIPIRLIVNKNNSGNTFSQWMKGLENVTGDLVWIAEADDYCEPNFLETLVKEFIDPDVVLAWSDSIIVDGLGKSEGYEYKKYYSERFGKYWNEYFKVQGSELLADCLLIKNVIPNASAAIFRRSTLSKNLKEILKYQFSGDWWFWIALAEKGSVSYCPQPINYHRRHNLSVMGEILRDDKKLIGETINFYKHMAEVKSYLIGIKTIEGIFDELEGLYRRFPKLQLESFWLRNHPEFADCYKSLAVKLNFQSLSINL